MENSLESVDSLPVETEKKRYSPPWVGFVMTWFLPGSAHFLAGRRRTGVICFLIWLLLSSILPFFPAGIPGKPFFYMTVILVVIFIVFYLGLLISSWRPTQRLGFVGWLVLIAAYFVLSNLILEPSLLLIKNYITEPRTIWGAPMAPTLLAPSSLLPEVTKPDRVFVGKLIYRLSEPRRGDVVVYRTTDPTDGSPQIWTHRLVGLPGETVDIRSPYVLIDGKKLTEPPIFEKIATKQDGFSGYYSSEDYPEDIDPERKEDGSEMEQDDRQGESESRVRQLPITLGADEYFLLGDNSSHYSDSRFRGPILRKDILGRVIRIFRPFNRIREVE